MTLRLQNGQIPPSLHFHFNLAEAPQAQRPWRRTEPKVGRTVERVSKRESQGKLKGDTKTYGDKSTGKGKSKDSNVCFNNACPGHMAKDWRRVRQSGGQNPFANVLTTATGQVSVGPSASQSPINFTVKRVAVVSRFERFLKYRLVPHSHGEVLPH